MHYYVNGFESQPQQGAPERREGYLFEERGKNENGKAVLLIHHHSRSHLGIGYELLILSQSSQATTLTSNFRDYPQKLSIEKPNPFKDNLGWLFV